MKYYWPAMILLGGALLPSASTAQTTTSTQTTAATHKTHRKHRRAVPAGTIAVPMETAPATSGPLQSPAQQSRQKTADANLLQQQEAQSAAAQRVNDQQVHRAQQQQEQIQRETRIQDAPGPAQTGVVPAAGAPAAPVNSDQRIQDAPGPAQTLPTQTLPAQTLPAPAAVPQQPSPATTPPQI